MFDRRRGGTRSDRTLAAGAAPGPRSRYWLIARSDEGRMEPLTIAFDGQETMPVFSFREEAELFMRLDGWRGWWIREISAGELASRLFGPYSHVVMMALDPLPEICDEGMTHLVSVRRNDFAKGLLDDRGFRVGPVLRSTTRRPSHAQTRWRPSRHTW